MEFIELSNEQRRQLIDAQQAYELWRNANQEFRHSYRGSMRWKRRSGTDYLYRIYHNTERSLGPRSTETERIKRDYVDQRTRLRQRTTRLATRLDQMERLNRALNLGRMPLIAARILRKLDEVGILGTKAFVVGTHSLFAYEARAGILFDGALTTTQDLDLLWDSRQRLSLALVEERAEGVIGLLRRVDRSFAAEPGHYRAANDDGFLVDFIRPERTNEALQTNESLTEADAVVAAAIDGLHWLVNAPKFEQIIVGEDGRPLWMSCADPRVFALHKHWISTKPDREATKRRRDAEQARAVATVVFRYLDMPFQAKDLSALPIGLTRAAKGLIYDIAKPKMTTRDASAKRRRR
jgi:hypothetical protein